MPIKNYKIRYPINSEKDMYLFACCSSFKNEAKSISAICIKTEQKGAPRSCIAQHKHKILKGTDSPTVDIEIYNKRRKEIVAKQ